MAIRSYLSKVFDIYDRHQINNTIVCWQNRIWASYDLVFGLSVFGKRTLTFAITFEL